MEGEAPAELTNSASQSQVQYILFIVSNFRKLHTSARIQITKGSVELSNPHVPTEWRIYRRIP